MQGEDAIEFANRVKQEIARKGGLVDLLWDGNLKRNKVIFILNGIKLQQKDLLSKYHPIRCRSS